MSNGNSDHDCWKLESSAEVLVLGSDIKTPRFSIVRWREAFCSTVSYGNAIQVINVLILCTVCYKYSKSKSILIFRIREAVCIMKTIVGPTDVSRKTIANRSSDVHVMYRQMYEHRSCYSLAPIVGHDFLGGFTSVVPFCWNPVRIYLVFSFCFRCKYKIFIPKYKVGPCLRAHLHPRRNIRHTVEYGGRS